MQPQPFAIGVITAYIGGYYFGSILNSIYQIARAAGVPLLVIQDELRELRMPPFGVEHVAGWIVIHPGQDTYANLAALVETGAPVVTVATALDGIACSSVVADNRGDTRALVNHLIDHGHRRIAYIDHGEEDWSQQRYLGYLDALRERGIAHDPALVIDTSSLRLDPADAGTWFLQRRGQEMAHTLIAQGIPCTALVAGTDHSAIAAMKALQAAGYRIPEDIAVVGFDDIAEAQYTDPPLTTARTRFEQLGHAAAEHLLAVLRCDAFLPKPIQVEQLLGLLAAHMHLTWRYAEAELLDPGGQDSADTMSLTPPREELVALFELASIGDILGLQARAAQLAHHDPALSPFAHRLERLASQFEPEQALALIARYIKPNQ